MNNDTIQEISLDIETVVDCPHCGDSNEVYVDPSVHHQRYIEDCQSCFRPIDLRIRCSDGDISVQAVAG